MAPFANPSDSPPSGVTLTYDYRNSMRGWDIATQFICLAISLICLSLRMYSKIFIIRNPGWEDWTCCLAFLGLVGYAVISFEADKHGSGIPQWRVAESDIQEFSKLANIGQILYGPLIFVTKLSILLLYIRVFTPCFKKTTFIFIQLLIWFNFFFYLADTIVKIFECTPRHKIWEKDADGYCININIPILVTSAINVASDCMILLLPIVCVWRLQMKMSKKIGISAIFAAGCFGCVSSVMRLAISVQISNTRDKTKDWYSQFLWTSAEVASGIIASCLPTLPSCFRYFFQKAATRLSCFSGGASAGGTRRRDHRNTSNDNDNNNRRHPTKQSQHQQTTQLNPLRTGLTTTTTKDSDFFHHSTWELDDNDMQQQWSAGDSQIFQGRCYTTSEAKAENTTMTSSRDGGSPNSWVDVEKAVVPGQGILKTVEVDIESSPGNRFDLPQAYGQQQQQQQQQLGQSQGQGGQQGPQQT